MSSYGLSSLTSSALKSGPQFCKSFIVTLYSSLNFNCSVFNNINNRLELILNVVD